VALTLTAVLEGRSFSTSVTSDGGVACSGTFTTEPLWLFKLGIRLYTLKFTSASATAWDDEKGHMRDGPECTTARWACRR